MRVYRLLKATLPIAAFVCACTTSLRASILATATYTSTPAGANGYLYDLTLTNTGTTTIGTFWFGWIPGAGFLSSAPTNIINPAGWNDVLTNANQAIQWTTLTLLNPGQALSGFEFDSQETPTQLLGTVPSGTGAGDPITTSFVYIAAPLADPGYQLVATPAATSSAPEPATFGLIGVSIGLCMLGRRLARGRSAPAKDYRESGQH